MSTNLIEFDKLEEYLKLHDYNYVRDDVWADHLESEWHQITVKGIKNNYLWDVVCHYGSYGYKQGLLEVQGSIAKDEPDSTRFNLTANDIIDILEMEEISNVSI